MQDAKSVCASNTSNETPEKEISETILFTKVSKIVVRNELTKRFKKYLHSENYKTLKEVKGNINKWNDSLCSTFGKVNITKCLHH